MLKVDHQRQAERIYHLRDGLRERWKNLMQQCRQLPADARGNCNKLTEQGMRDVF
jgi:hypothetical protein